MHKRFMPLAVALLTITIFVFDVITPVGVALSILYVLPLLLTFTSPRERDQFYVCLIATVLLWLGLFLKPNGLHWEYAVVNRVLGTLVLCLLGYGVYQLKRTQTSLTEAETRRAKALQDLMFEREERSHAETAFLGAEENRHRAEKEYLGSQLRLEGIIQSAMDAIITIDHDQKIVVFNHAAERMFQCPAGDAIGQPLDRFIPARFREAHRSDVKKFGQSGVTSRKMGQLGTVTGLRSDGEEFPIEAAISQVTVEGTRFLTVILRDVTERMRLEEQLRRTERVAELGTVASGMAHEIGTPMNVILGRAEYLLERVAEEPVKKGLQTIVAQVERITRVMNQLLSFARRKPPKPGPLQLQDVVESCLEMFQERLSNHRVQVDMEVDPGLPNVQADSDQMSQVIINLIMNALHAMPDGGRLRLALAPNKDAVRLTVADTGHGIPPHVLSRIFDPFFTTKEFGKGTGLGLTVVKGIIEEHHGSIHVESEPGKGTTFSIILPRSRS